MCEHEENVELYMPGDYTPSAIQGHIISSLTHVNFQIAFCCSHVEL